MSSSVVTPKCEIVGTPHTQWSRTNTGENVSIRVRSMCCSVFRLLIICELLTFADPVKSPVESKVLYFFNPSNPIDHCSATLRRNIANSTLHYALDCRVRSSSIVHTVRLYITSTVFASLYIANILSHTSSSERISREDECKSTM
jgi:hypothetical protein